MMYENWLKDQLYKVLTEDVKEPIDRETAQKIKRQVNTILELIKEKK